MIVHHQFIDTRKIQTGPEQAPSSRITAFYQFSFFLNILSFPVFLLPFFSFSLLLKVCVFLPLLFLLIFLFYSSKFHGRQHPKCCTTAILSLYPSSTAMSSSVIISSLPSLPTVHTMIRHNIQMIALQLCHALVIILDTFVLTSHGREPEQQRSPF